MGVSKTTTADTYVSNEDDFSLDARPEGASSAKESTTAVASGWAAADVQNAPSGDFPVEFKHSEEQQLIKFVDEGGPFATYSQHFLKQKTEGRRSYVCLGEGCPLCTKLQDKPERKTAFTIANVVDGAAQRQMLIATPRLYKSLHAAEFSPQGPLVKNYWAISRTGKMQQTQYNLFAVKTRDLGEDWGLDPDTIEAQVAEIKPFDRSAIKTHTYAELLEVAEALL
jgi:hypothetical protein